MFSFHCMAILTVFLVQLLQDGDKKSFICTKQKGCTSLDIPSVHRIYYMQLMAATSQDVAHLFSLTRSETFFFA